MSPTMFFTDELEQEGKSTRRLLERVPDGQLKWRPHDKSMTLGQLALHVARIPGDMSSLAAMDRFDAAHVDFDPPHPADGRELVPALEASLAAAKAYLSSLDDQKAQQDWTLTLRGDKVMSMSRLLMIRSLMLNHWYHHRGQLAVYLRMLNVEVPATYGRSADENPFQ